MNLLVWLRNFQAATLSTLDEFGRAYPPMSPDLGDVAREFNRWCEDAAMDEVRVGVAAAEGVEKVAQMIVGIAHTAAADFPEVALELAFYAEQIRQLLNRYGDGLRKQAEWVPSPSAETKFIRDDETTRRPVDTDTPMPRRLLNNEEVDQLTERLARDLSDPFPTPDEPLDPPQLR